MKNFELIHEMALRRKGGQNELQALLPTVRSVEEIATTPDDRFLAEMTRCINQAGFSWKVIDQKWPQFEEAFFGFNLNKLSLLSEEQWEAYTKDKRVVRSWQKIKAVKDNLVFVLDIRFEHQSFARFIADWPPSDQVGLMDADEE